MAEADSRLIEWLLHESGVSNYRISKDLGIAESTLSRIASKETPMDAVRFGNARKLTEYARSIQAKGAPGQDSQNKAPIEPDADSTPEGEDET